MNSIAQFESPTLDGNRLIESFKRGMSPRTLEAYAGDLEHFGGFCGEAPGMAVRDLLTVSHGQANGLGLAYRASMIEAGLAPATINRRLSAIKSVVKFARTLGLTDWQPEIDGVKSQSYRDTAGPGVDGSRALLKAARDQAVGYDQGSVQIARAKRNAAIVRMLFDMGMRRGELTSLDMEHVDLDARKVWVMGKGKRERIPMTLPIETTKALREWLDTRSTICLPHDKPVFVGLSGPKIGKRLSGKGIWEFVSTAGKRVGIKAAPHGLRHASITEVLDATGDVRAGQKFARHSNVNTTMIYDDNRSDIGGVAAQRVATILSGD